MSNPTPYDPQAAAADVAARLRDAEAAMLLFAEHWRYIPTLPRGPKGERAILMLDYLLPDLQHIITTHYISLGWRHHPELAVIKPRTIVGGAFEDLVAYVPIDQPDTPILVQQDPTPNPAPELWSVKPVVTEIFEERPDDD